jgi:hypothetical protein
MSSVSVAVMCRNIYPAAVDLDSLEFTHFDRVLVAIYDELLRLLLYGDN